MIDKSNIADEPTECQAQIKALSDGICEGQLCQVQCPAVPCEGAETCVNGRCVYAYESFEIAEGEALADLGRMGWNALPIELQNLQTTIVFEGRRDCALGDERCAGPASQGVRFVSIERQPLQASVSVAPTCRPCACCLDCLFQPESDPPPDLASCPGNRPMPLSCPVSTPQRCDAVCQQCSTCPDADMDRLGMNLTSCELPVAQKTCPGCLTCKAEESTCTASMCPICATAPTSKDCQDCVTLNCLSSQACQDCAVCDTATGCIGQGTAECIQSVDDCRALGANGCFPAAVGYGRSTLTVAEQALVSAAVNLSSADGEVVLQFDHVPFNVGETYRPGVADTAPSEWPIEPQELRVELCAGSCEVEASWKLGEYDVGGPAVLPAANRRRNGLLLGSQGELDWRTGQVRIAVPSAFRTSQFRFRFVPNLSRDTRLGIDNIMVRRLR